MINANINQSNLVNNQSQGQSQNSQLLRTKVIRDSNNNQINIQRQQQIITQSQTGQGMSQQNSNEVRNALITGSIKYEKNSQNKDPMMYSFGQKSPSSTRQNLMNAENSDFLVSSLRNRNNQNITESKMVVSSSQVSNGRVINSSNVVIRSSGSSGGQIQMSGGQKGMSSPGQALRSRKEPVDTDSRKKNFEIKEENVKKEINEFPLEPRDSKKQ